MHLFKKIGDPVLVPPDGYDYLGWLTVSGQNLIDAQDNLRDILDGINYRVVKFDPASSLGKTTRKYNHSFALLSKETILAAKFTTNRNISTQNIRKLHVGIACNIFDGEDGSVEADLCSVGNNIQKTLNGRGYKTTFFDFNNVPKVFNELRNSDVDIIFNVAERVNKSSLLDESHAAAMLDMLQIPYTGSNTFTLALCIDKIRVKKLLTYHEIPTPQWDYAYTMDDDVDDEMNYPLIVKPGNTDNSIGITNDSVVTNKRELKSALSTLLLNLENLLWLKNILKEMNMMYQ